jgi:hypothetical protein
MYVGISKSLKQEILSHIERMAQAQLARIVESTHPFPEGLKGSEWAARIERQAWGDPIKLKDKLPDEWMRRHQHVDVHFMTDKTDNLTVVYSGDAIDFPPVFSDQYAPDINFEMSELESEIREPIERHLTLVAETGDRYEKTKEEIVKLLERCKSLNEAVQLFPDLRYFLSESIKERLDKKRDGGMAAPDERLVGIDTALITSAMVVEQLHPEKG